MRSIFLFFEINQFCLCNFGSEFAEIIVIDNRLPILLIRGAESLTLGISRLLYRWVTIVYLDSMYWLLTAHPFLWRDKSQKISQDVMFCPNSYFKVLKKGLLNAVLPTPRYRRYGELNFYFEFLCEFESKTAKASIRDLCPTDLYTKSNAMSL